MSALPPEGTMHDESRSDPRVAPCEVAYCDSKCATCGGDCPDGHPVDWDWFGWGTGYCSRSCYDRRS